MIRETPTAAEAPLTAHELERELDRLSLDQALRDFEIANARVVDLTQRLISLSQEVITLRDQLVGAQEALVDARRDNEAIRASATFKVAGLAQKVRARVRF